MQDDAEYSSLINCALVQLFLMLPARYFAQSGLAHGQAARLIRCIGSRAPPALTGLLPQSSCMHAAGRHTVMHAGPCCTDALMMTGLT